MVARVDRILDDVARGVHCGSADGGGRSGDIGVSVVHCCAGGERYKGERQRRSCGEFEHGDPRLALGEP